MMCQKDRKNTEGITFPDIGNKIQQEKKKSLSSKRLHSTERDKLYNKESICIHIFIFACMFTRCQVHSKEEIEEGHYFR